MLRLFRKRIHQPMTFSEIKIAIIYFIPKSNVEKYNNWTDGFTQGINIIEKTHNVTWINIEDGFPDSDRLNSFDFIIAKCCWNSTIDTYLRNLKELKTPCGIVISCSIIPKKNDPKFYKILWHQTFWYKQFLPKHKRIIHAFGINSNDFNYENIEKTIDVLSIGAVTWYKRHEKLIDFPGSTKVVIGDTNIDDSAEIIKNLKSKNITVLEYTNQKELSKLINQAKTVYIPCELNGGGERAVLEARKCGANVVTEEDNPKLKELLNSPIWDEKHYGNQIKNGIEQFLGFTDKTSKTNLIISTDRIKAGNFSFHNGHFSHKGDEALTIGSYCALGKNISIITSNHDTNFISISGYIFRRFFNTNHPGEINITKTLERSKGPITIGNDVWIGDDVKILSGVTIQDGAIIKAGSIVSKNVGAYEIHVGIPNKKIKMRFNKEIVQLLLELKWWNWSEKLIKKNKKLFSMNLNQVSVKEVKETINF